MTLLQYNAYRLMSREGDPSQFFRGGRLFQEYLVNAYGRIESNRLQFILKEQKKLRADTYCGLADAPIFLFCGLPLHSPRSRRCRP